MQKRISEPRRKASWRQRCSRNNNNNTDHCNNVKDDDDDDEDGAKQKQNSSHQPVAYMHYSLYRYRYIWVCGAVCIAHRLTLSSRLLNGCMLYVFDNAITFRLYISFILINCTRAVWLPIAVSFSQFILFLLFSITGARTPPNTYTLKLNALLFHCFSSMTQPPNCTWTKLISCTWHAYSVNFN